MHPFSSVPQVILNRMEQVPAMEGAGGLLTRVDLTTLRAATFFSASLQLVAN
jgi:hypothetical protein